MQYLSILIKLAGTTAAVAVAACGSVSPMGLAAAARLDPVNTPPSDITLAISVPRSLRLADGDAAFRIAYRDDSDGTTTVLDETAELEILAEGFEAAAFDVDPDDRVYLARIAAADVPRIVAVQRGIRALRAGGDTGEGALAITVVGGCFEGAAPDRLAVGTWVRTDPTGAFVQLNRPEDISRIMGARDAAILKARLAPCPD